MRTSTTERLRILAHMMKFTEVPPLQFLRHRLQILGLLVIALLLQASYAQSPGAIDLLRREFVTKDLVVKSFGPIHWIGKGQFYTVLEPSDKARD